MDRIPIYERPEMASPSEAASPDGIDQLRHSISAAVDELSHITYLVRGGVDRLFGQTPTPAGAIREDVKRSLGNDSMASICQALADQVSALRAEVGRIRGAKL